MRAGHSRNGRPPPPRPPTGHGAAQQATVPHAVLLGFSSTVTGLRGGPEIRQAGQLLCRNSHRVNENLPVFI